MGHRRGDHKIYDAFCQAFLFWVDIGFGGHPWPVWSTEATSLAIFMNIGFIFLDTLLFKTHLNVNHLLSWLMDDRTISCLGVDSVVVTGSATYAPGPKRKTDGAETCFGLFS
jgi:hypothetical protein